MCFHELDMRAPKEKFKDARDKKVERNNDSACYKKYALHIISFWMPRLYVGNKTFESCIASSKKQLASFKICGYIPTWNASVNSKEFLDIHIYRSGMTD